MTDAHHPDTPRNRGDTDAPHMSPVTPAEDARTIMLNRISWGAVLAGVVVMLVTQLILNLLGIGIGAATLDPAAGAAENPSASSFSIGAGIWFVLAGVLASLAGGYAAGRLAGKPKESTASGSFAVECGIVVW
jgi:hypothetical protein